RRQQTANNASTAPVTSRRPGHNLTLQCYKDRPAMATVTADDNCDGTVAVTPSETESKSGSNCNNTITRSWQAKDQCLNSAACGHNIKVSDTTPPVLTGCPGQNLTLQCYK